VSASAALIMQDSVIQLLGGLDPRAFGEAPYFLSTEKVEVPETFSQNWSCIPDDDAANSRTWLRQAWSAQVPAIVIVTRLPSEAPKHVSSALAHYWRAQAAALPPVFLLPIGKTCAPPCDPELMECAKDLLSSGSVDDVIWGSPKGFAFVLALRAKISHLRIRIDHLHDQMRHRGAALDQVEDRIAALNMTRWQYLPSRLLHNIPRVRTDLQDDQDCVAGFGIGSKLIRGLFGTTHIATRQVGRALSCCMLVVDKHGHTFSFLGLKMINHHLRLLQDLSQSRHPNIAHLLAVYHTPTRFCICTEICGTRTLYSRLKLRDRPARDDDPEPLSEIALSSLTRQVCNAVAHLHSNSICHRDIKPENFTIHEQENGVQVKLGSFELARTQIDEQLCSSSCGTMPFAAPEMIMEKTYDGMAADMWSVGIVFVEVCCGLRLIERMLSQRDGGEVIPSTGVERNIGAFRKAAQKLSQAFNEDGIIDHLLEHIVPEASDMRPQLLPLLDGLLKTCASERPTAASVLQSLG